MMERDGRTMLEDRGTEKEVAEHEDRVSRRTLIGHAAAVAAGAAAASLASAGRPTAAEAANGDDVRTGQASVATGTSPGLWGKNLDAEAPGGPTPGPGVKGESKDSHGVLGISENESGVYGGSTNGFGVRATSSGNDAVYAVCQAGPFAAVHAYAPLGVGVNVEAAGTGVKVASDSANAVEASSNNGIGVYCSGTECGCAGGGITCGVSGESENGLGVSGYSSQNAGVVGSTDSGTGVRATAGSNGSLAIDVQGPAKFSNAGTSTISRGRVSKTITGVKVGTRSAILVTLMGNAGGVVKYAYRRSSTSFTVVLSGRAVRTVKFAYFIIN